MLLALSFLPFLIKRGIGYDRVPLGYNGGDEGNRTSFYNYLKSLIATTLPLQFLYEFSYKIYESTALSLARKHMISLFSVNG
jgi:hypothetical protein